MVWNWFFFGGVVLVFLLFCDCVVGLENGKFGDVLLGVQLRLLCPSHTADEWGQEGLRLSDNNDIIQWVIFCKKRLYLAVARCVRLFGLYIMFFSYSKRIASINAMYLWTFFWRLNQRSLWLLVLTLRNSELQCPRRIWFSFIKFRCVWGESLSPWVWWVSWRACKIFFPHKIHIPELRKWDGK